MAKKNKNKILWIFLHLPKTGGTTFSHHLINNLKKEEVLLTSKLRYGLISDDIKKDRVRVILGHATYYGIHKLFPNKNPRYIVFLRDPAERFASSYNFEMRTKEGGNTSFQEWYGSQIKNEMVYFLDMKYRGKEGAKANLPRPTLNLFAKLFQNKRVYLLFQKIYRYYTYIFQSSDKTQKRKLENAKKLLDICWHVGFIEGLDKSLRLLFREIGVPVKWKNENITTRKKRIFNLDEKTRKKVYEDNKYDKELYDYALSLRKGKGR